MRTKGLRVLAPECRGWVRAGGSCHRQHNGAQSASTPSHIYLVFLLVCAQALPPQHQTLLFSATMPSEIEGLAAQVHGWNRRGWG